MFGWDLIDGEMKANGFQATTVKKIFQLYVDELPIGEIINKLQRGRHRRRTSYDKWNSNMIYSILKKPEYAGLTYDSNGLLVPAIKFERIIDVKTWKKVQDTLDENYILRETHHRQGKHMFSGIITCKKCHQPFFVIPVNKKTKSGIKEYKYYYHKRKQGIKCTAKKKCLQSRIS